MLFSAGYKWVEIRVWSEFESGLVLGVSLLGQTLSGYKSLRPLDRDAKRHTKKSAKPSNFNFLTNQRPASEILTNGITWQEIHFGFWTNQRTIGFLLASLTVV